MLSLALTFNIMISYELQPGPTIPTTKSTISTYCPKNICSTPGTGAMQVDPELNTYHKLTVVEYSEVCQKMIDKNIKSNCPTVNELKKYDNTNQKISGKFITINGKTIREKPVISNHYLFYNATTVCIICKVDLNKKNLFNTIIIEPHGFTWIEKDHIVKNDTPWNSFSDRFMEGCHKATIGYSDILLNDTIRYIQSKCTITQFNGTRSHGIIQAPIDYEHAPQYQYMRWLHSAVKASVGNCINKSCEIKSIGHKW